LEGFYFRLEESLSLFKKELGGDFAQGAIVVELVDSSDKRCPASFFADGQHIPFEWKSSIEAPEGSHW
jgi:hypothetical protein